MYVPRQVFNFERILYFVVLHGVIAFQSCCMQRDISETSDIIGSCFRWPGKNMPYGIIVKIEEHA
jgi:hypothetical protein